MSSPFLTLYCQQVPSIDLEDFVQLYRLGEIVSSSGDLSYDIRVGSHESIAERRNDDKSGSELGEWGEAIFPSPVATDYGNPRTDERGGQTPKEGHDERFDGKP